MHRVKQLFKLIRKGLWIEKADKNQLDCLIKWALDPVPFELLGCE